MIEAKQESTQDILEKHIHADLPESEKQKLDDIPVGTVVLAATPIGNISDASQRLKDLIANATVIAAEDTRRFYDLANRLSVHVKGRIVAYHDHNERYLADRLLDEVEQGDTVLVVSDAGMPTINDPGLAIVRHAIERDLPVTCAPGPSALLDALALSGLPTDRFCYEGFLPRKSSERRQYLHTLRTEQRTLVFYESPRRLAKSMADLLEVFGPQRRMALCRELTKTYEEVKRGNIGQICQFVQANPARGEIVLVVAGATAQEAVAADTSVLTVLDLAQLALARSREEGVRIKDAIRMVVAEHPLPDGSLPKRKAVYTAVLELENKTS